MTSVNCCCACATLAAQPLTRRRARYAYGYAVLYILSCGIVVTVGCPLVRLVAERGIVPALENLHTLLPNLQLALCWCGIYFILAIWPCGYPSFYACACQGVLAGVIRARGTPIGESCILRSPWLARATGLSSGLANQYCLKDTHTRYHELVTYTGMAVQLIPQVTAGYYWLFASASRVLLTPAKQFLGKLDATAHTEAVKHGVALPASTLLLTSPGSNIKVPSPQRKKPGSGGALASPSMPRRRRSFRPEEAPSAATGTGGKI